MLKILFTEFAELRQGDGKGPQYFPGKAYWLTPDQAVRWKSEGLAEDAPEDMPAENEADRGPIPLRPENVRIIRRQGKHHVIGPDNLKFHDEPLSAHEAEKLRQRILAGEVKPVQEISAPPPEPIAAPETFATIEPAVATASATEPEIEADFDQVRDYEPAQLPQTIVTPRKFRPDRRDL